MTARRFALLLLLVLTTLIAQGACLPHTHSGLGVGLYNGEHDLTLLATGATVAPLPLDTQLHVVLTTGRADATIPSAPVFFVVRDAESRAPPSA